MDPRERVTAIGFTPAGTCNCNGTFNRKYKKGEWLIYISNSQFKVKRNGSTIKGYTNIEGLEKYLQETFQDILVRK